MNKKRYKHPYPVGYQPDIYQGDEEVRYSLGKTGKNILFCISVNPSHACDQYSDPTMNTLINVSRKHGFDGCIMINPAPYISSTPSFLPEKGDEKLVDNEKIISELFGKYNGSTILCGWGNYYFSENEWFKKSLNKIISIAKLHNMKFVCIRKTKKGAPTHLSYLNRDHEIFDFGRGEYELVEYDVSKYND